MSYNVFDHSHTVSFDENGYLDSGHQENNQFIDVISWETRTIPESHIKACLKLFPGELIQPKQLFLLVSLHVFE